MEVRSHTTCPPGGAHGGRVDAAGVVLAGGRSSRMGTPKACLEWYGSTLLYRAAAATISSRSRVRFSRLPPYSSVRWFVARERKPRTIERVRALQLDAVEPALLQWPRLGVAGDDLGDLAVVDRLGHLAEQRVGHRRRPHTGRRVYMLEAWPPLWLIWAKIGTSWRVDGLGDAPVPGTTSGWKPWIIFS